MKTWGLRPWGGVKLYTVERVPHFTQLLRLSISLVRWCLPNKMETRSMMIISRKWVFQCFFPCVICSSRVGMWDGHPWYFCIMMTNTSLDDVGCIVWMDFRDIRYRVRKHFLWMVRLTWHFFSISPRQCLWYCIVAIVNARWALQVIRRNNLKVLNDVLVIEVAWLLLYLEEYLKGWTDQSQYTPASWFLPSLGFVFFCWRKSGRVRGKPV